MSDNGAVQQRLQHRALANIESADPLGGIHLVAGDRQQIDFQLIDVDADFADGLGRVGV